MKIKSVWSYLFLVLLIGLTAVYVAYRVFIVGISEDRIVKEFSESYDSFAIVANYLEKESAYFEISYGKGKLIINDFGGNGNKRTINIDDEKVRQAMIFILKDLKYKEIVLWPDEIYFRKQMMLTYDDGVKYLKKGIEPKGWLRYEYIKESWYYFCFGHV